MSSDISGYILAKFLNFQTYEPEYKWNAESGHTPLRCCKGKLNVTIFLKYSWTNRLSGVFYGIIERGRYISCSKSPGYRWEINRVSINPHRGSSQHSLFLPRPMVTMVPGAGRGLYLRTRTLSGKQRADLGY